MVQEQQESRLLNLTCQSEANFLSPNLKKRDGTGTERFAVCSDQDFPPSLTQRKPVSAPTQRRTPSTLLANPIPFHRHSPPPNMSNSQRALCPALPKAPARSFPENLKQGVVVISHLQMSAATMSLTPLPFATSPATPPTSGTPQVSGNIPPPVVPPV